MAMNRYIDFNQSDSKIFLQTLEQMKKDDANFKFAYVLVENEENFKNPKKDIQIDKVFFMTSQMSRYY